MIHSSWVSNWLFLIFCLLSAALAQYTLKKTYDSTNMFDSFDFIKGPDIYTNGSALYVGKEEALSSGLAKIENNKVYLGVDYGQSSTGDTSRRAAGGDGRRSVRLESHDVFNSGLLVADFDRLPGNACGMWPAFWLLHDQAMYSEIDIIEGVSMNSANEVTMYTSESCELEPSNSDGEKVVTKCVDAEQSGSCGVQAREGTFGDAFNAKNGGVYAFQLDAHAMKLWIWDRDSVPQDIIDGQPQADENVWGVPAMNFNPGTCNMLKAWQQMKIVINITFCGDMAGDADMWDNVTGCAKKTGKSTCNAYVGSTPEAFQDTYFSINWIKQFDQTPNSRRSMVHGRRAIS